MAGQDGRAGFPVGASVTRAELDGDPHPLLRELREREPVSWVPALGGWLVTPRDFALRVLRDAGTFTVDDPRFSTARVVGPSMLSLDGAEHKRHRDPFSAALRVAGSRGQLEAFTRAEAARLVAAMAPAGTGRTAARAGRAAGRGGRGRGARPWRHRSRAHPVLVRRHRRRGVRHGGTAGERRAVRAAPPGTQALGADRGAAAFGMLRASLEAAMASGDGDGRSVLAAAADGGLGASEVVSNAAVLMFGGIETTEGMICNAMLHLLSHPDQARQLMAEPGLVENAIEESLRLEPAAAVLDRYATADVRIGAAAIRRGDLVTVSLAGANRDPAFFADPDTFDVRRANARQNLAFARGPHFCIGAHLARLETRTAIVELLDRLPGLRIDAARRRPAPRGVVFRKPPELAVAWDAGPDRGPQLPVLPVSPG